jgi:endonuclease G
MARFRRNHGDGKRGASSYARLAVFGVFVVFIMYLLTNTFGTYDATSSTVDAKYYLPTEVELDGERTYLPVSSEEDVVVHHTDYSLAYSEEHEQARWVAYELTEAELKVPNVKRSNYFDVDPDIRSRSAKHSDYTRSGYTRGHLAPAGDMAHSKTAMEESFYMSNISPQVRVFNNGIWKELEEQTRDWAYKYDRLFITTGGILKPGLKQIGRNRVSVPEAFYKVLLYVNGDQRGAIGYVIPHDKSEAPLEDYAMSIDQVEAITGIDFYADLLAPEEEKKVESTLDLDQWPVSKKRYRLRVDKWNYQ